MDILHVILLSLLALAGAAIVVIAKREVHALEVAVHKWAQRVATALTRAGISAIVTAPLNDVAVDDVEKAIGHGETAAQYLEHPENWAKELTNMIAVGLADPTLKPKLVKFFNDASGGASSSTLQSDAADVVAASPLADIDQADADLRDSVEHIFAHAHHPELAELFDKLPDGQKFLSKLAIAGKVAAAPAAATPTDPTPAAGSIAVPSGATVTIQHP